MGTQPRRLPSQWPSYPHLQTALGERRTSVQNEQGDDPELLSRGSPSQTLSAQLRSPRRGGPQAAAPTSAAARGSPPPGPGAHVEERRCRRLSHCLCGDKAQRAAEGPRTATASQPGSSRAAPPTRPGLFCFLGACATPPPPPGRRGLFSLHRNRHNTQRLGQPETGTGRCPAAGQLRARVIAASTSGCGNEAAEGPAKSSLACPWRIPRAQAGRRFTGPRRYDCGDPEPEPRIHQPVPSPDPSTSPTGMQKGRAPRVSPRKGTEHHTTQTAPHHFTPGRGSPGGPGPSCPTLITAQWGGEGTWALASPREVAVGPGWAQGDPERTQDVCYGPEQGPDGDPHTHSSILETKR